MGVKSVIMETDKQTAVLETPRLILRTMLASDFEAMWAIFADPKVMAAFDSPPFTHAQMQGWLDRNIAHQQRHGYGLFSVILKSEGTLIGDCGLEHMQLDGKEHVELGYDFRSDYWNRGFASEAAGAVRDFACYELQLQGLISLIRVGNQASRRVSEKIGMSLVREMKSSDTTYWLYSMDCGAGSFSSANFPS